MVAGDVSGRRRGGNASGNASGTIVKKDTSGGSSDGSCMPKGHIQGSDELARLKAEQHDLLLQQAEAVRAERADRVKLVQLLGKLQAAHQRVLEFDD